MRLLIVVFAFLLSGCVSEISTLTARGDVNGVQQELAKGVDKASLNEALCRASESGHYQLAKLLIEKGADSNQKECHIIKTPLCGVFYGDNGASYGHEHASIVELLVKNGAEINGPVCINDTHLITRF
ncbi:MAG: ankyrin repeat domain-containing protein, partial [Gammaproteobacteria bacterium]